MRHGTGISEACTVECLVLGLQLLPSRRQHKLNQSDAGPQRRARQPARHSLMSVQIVQIRAPINLPKQPVKTPWRLQKPNLVTRFDNVATGIRNPPKR